MLLALTGLASAAPRKPSKAVTVEAKARAEFAVCYQQSIQAMKECSFGGCGNILAACYERQLAVVQLDTDQKLLRLQEGPCREEVDSLEQAHAAWRERLDISPTLKDAWAGQDLRVNAALLRNHTLKAMLEACTKEKGQR
ncbi:MAG: hypothetical protein RL318_1689 [Fibrobacterota bacterium]